MLLLQCRCNGIRRAAVAKTGISGQDQDILFYFFQTCTNFFLMKFFAIPNIIAKYYKETFSLIWDGFVKI